MILPRPINTSVETIAAYLSQHLDYGEEFTLEDRVYCYQRCVEDNQTVEVFDKSRHRYRRLGIINVYVNITKDIGLAVPIMPGTLTAQQWLYMGIDGVKNIDRLCKAMAMNGGILPKDDNNGKIYSEIIKESNHWIGNNNDSNTIMEIIDHNLVKYGTYLAALAQADKLVIKDREAVKERK